MEEMKTHENAVSLLSTVVSSTIALVVGTGLSILLNGFVRGFLALTAIALVLALIVAWRRPFSLEFHLRDSVPRVDLVRRSRTR
jgi:hypothetical protein